MNKLICQEVLSRDKTALIAADVAREPRADLYGYELALYCAGVDVLALEQFGSYQGDWWAQVKFPNGEVYFVGGSYGSCSGCDAFEAEFGWNADERLDYAHKLRDFGRGYLENCFTFDDALKEAGRNAEWDTEAGTMMKWILDRKPDVPAITSAPPVAPQG